MEETREMEVACTARHKNDVYCLLTYVPFNRNTVTKIM